MVPLAEEVPDLWSTVLNQDLYLNAQFSMRRD